MNGFGEIINSPEDQARTEVNAHLNRVALDSLATESIVRELREEREGFRALWLAAHRELERTRSKLFAANVEAEEWEQLYVLAVERVMALSRPAETIEFLTSAVKNYASHAWNDIKREMERRGL